jgi:hypothetical protein
MLILILALALNAEPTEAPAELVAIKPTIGNSYLVVNLRNHPRRQEYVPTGGVFRIAPGFLPGDQPSPEIPEVGRIRRPAR